MDLRLQLQDTILNIRVAGILQTPHGYLFEGRPTDSYVFAISGKIKLNESSEEAIKREIHEEIGMIVDEVQFRGIIENFYESEEGKVHEICFVYEIKEIFIGAITTGFKEISTEKIETQDIRPMVINEIMKGNTTIPMHFITK